VNPPSRASTDSLSALILRMQGEVEVATPPEKPVVIFDGDCQFCRFWIKRWQKASGPRVDYMASQDRMVRDRFPEIPAHWFQESVLLVETDGWVVRGAEAVCLSLSANPRHGWLRKLFYGVPGLRWMAERGYRFVSAHRSAFAALNRFFFGPKAEQA